MLFHIIRTLFTSSGVTLCNRRDNLTVTKIMEKYSIKCPLVINKYPNYINVLSYLIKKYIKILYLSVNNVVKIMDPSTLYIRNRGLFILKFLHKVQQEYLFFSDKHQNVINKKLNEGAINIKFYEILHNSSLASADRKFKSRTYSQMDMQTVKHF